MVYPDVLRALSCIAVVFLSVSMAAGRTALSGLFTWAVPLFVMLSGMFFLDGSWYISPRDMARKYGLRLLVAYLVWFPISVGVNLATGGVLQGMLNGQSLYLNFLFVMIVLYAFSPALRVFTRAAQPKELQFAVLLGYVLGCLYPFFQVQLGTTRLMDHAMLGLGLLSVFVMGWFLRSAMLTRKQLRVIYLLGGLCLLLTLRGFWLSATAFTTDPAMMIVSPDAVLIAMALFLVVKNTLSGMRLSRRVLRPIAALSQLSFGIYLIHPLLLAALCCALNHAGVVLPAGVFIPVAAIGLLLVSGALTYVIRKIPKIGTYLA